MKGRGGYNQRLCNLCWEKRESVCPGQCLPLSCSLRNGLSRSRVEQRTKKVRSDSCSHSIVYRHLQFCSSFPGPGNWALTQNKLFYCVTVLSFYCRYFLCTILGVFLSCIHFLHAIHDYTYLFYIQPCSKMTVMFVLLYAATWCQTSGRFRQLLAWSAAFASKETRLSRTPSGELKWLRLQPTGIPRLLLPIG